MHASEALRALIAGTLCVCASLAYAETETVVVTIETTTIPESGFFGTVEVPQFDPGPNEFLLGVDFDLLIDFAGTMGFENTDPNRATTFELGLSWFLELWGPDPNDPELLIDLTASRTVQGLVDPFDGVIDFGGFSGATFDVLVEDVAGHGDITDPNDFSWFEGAGTVELPLTASFEGTASAGSTEMFEAEFWDVTFGGELTVTYTYIPEPMLAGLLLLTGFALRRVR